APVTSVIMSITLRSGVRCGSCGPDHNRRQGGNATHRVGAAASASFRVPRNGYNASMNTAARLHPEFAGHDRLIAAIDAAVASGDEHAVTAALRGALCNLIRDSEVRLPSCVYEPVKERYARRELYRSPEHGYSILAMTWGPGQGTPLHDHSGLWCVEGVWAGELEITQYELLETDGDRYRFRTSG